MNLKAYLSVAAVVAAAWFSVAGVVAAPLTPLDALKAQAAGQSAVEHVVGPYGPCVWTRYRGWHRNGAFGTWRSCTPGAGWRYERRCWFGPGGARYCRFYG